MFDIITFGSAVVDVFVDTDLSERGKFISYPVGSKILLKNLRFDIGGGGTNTAVAFSRLGLKTGYIGKVGDDGNGVAILKNLENENINFFGKVEREAISGYSIILDSKEHDRTILTFKGANDYFRFSELKLAKLNTRWLYLASLLGESFKTQKKLAAYLSVRGTKIAFNPSEYLIERLDIKQILNVCEVLILNKEEAQLLKKKSKSGGKNLLESLYDLGPKIVVVTDRDKKVYAYDGNKIYSIVPHKVKVVERTGAGDAFASGFVAGQILGKSIEASLKLGLRESESVLRYFGAKNKLLRMNLK